MDRKTPTNFSSTGGLIRAAVNAPILRFRASTDVIDRHRTIVNQKGIDFSNFTGTFLWGHDSFKGLFGGAPKIENSIGKVVARELTQFKRGEEDGLATDIDVRFSKANPFGVMAEGMVREGILGNTSIGFIPKKDHALTVGEEVIKVFDEVELLEVSLVPVPANPEAQALVRSMYDCLKEEADPAFGVQFRSGENGDWAWQDDDAGGGSWRFRVAPGADAGGVRLMDLLKLATEVELGIVPPNVSTNKAEEGTPWSRPSLGDFTSKTWGELTVRERRRIMGHFAWAPSNNTEEFVFSDLKLPHHRASDAKVVFRGVSAAMGALLGARGGVDIPGNDRRKVYDHLAAHYRAFNRVPPEFRTYEDPPPEGADTGSAQEVVAAAFQEWHDEQRALRS